MTFLLLLLLPHSELLDAIEQVESGGNCEVVGDNGKALGPFQIWKAFFQDAVEFDKSLSKYKYEDVKDPKVARLVVLAYWKRYCTKERLGREPTDQDRARMVNGGPNGHKKKATEKYWEKVKKVLKCS